MKYSHLTDAELIRYVDNLQSATSLERTLTERLHELHAETNKETESGRALPERSLYESE
jgi:hypothetical protein